jgi:4-methyl-5(b-hydroxyethyl)-thiazole monophosphate biosynthesis
MAKKAIIILATGFEELEAVSVIDILRRGGVELTITGLDGINISSSRNVTIVADKKFEDIKEDFDAVILPGGMPGAMHLSHSKKLSDFIKNMCTKGTIIAAICASPAVVLAPLGILDNKTATCYPGMQNEFPASTKYKEDAVVIDGNLITSRGPGTSMDFGYAIVERLIGKITSDKLRKDMLADKR